MGTPIISDDSYVIIGGPDEETYYVTECGSGTVRQGRSRG
jgi:hypothetical protein